MSGNNKGFARQLVAFRDKQQWTNAGLADYLSRVTGREISVRTLENWLQGRRPHVIWREQIEKAIA